MLNDIIKSLLLLLLVRKENVSDGIDGRASGRQSEKEGKLIFFDYFLRRHYYTHYDGIGAFEFQISSIRTINYECWIFFLHVAVVVALLCWRFDIKREEKATEERKKSYKLFVSNSERQQQKSASLRAAAVMAKAGSTSFFNCVAVTDSVGSVRFSLLFEMKKK